MTENVYDCYHGLILILGDQNYCQEQNLNFTCDNVQKMCIESQKQHLEKSRKTGYFQIIATAVWFDVFQ